MTVLTGLCSPIPTHFASSKAHFACRLPCTDAPSCQQGFEQARRWGYVSSQNIPIVKSERLKSQRRPHFEIHDYRRLTRISVVRIRKAPGERVKQDRQLLHDWILIMANSGMGPTEAKNLRWKDVTYTRTCPSSG